VKSPDGKNHQNLNTLRLAHSGQLRILGSTILLSYVHSDFDSSGRTVQLDIPGVITVSEDQEQNDEADQYEAQYIYRANVFNVVFGGSYTDADIDASLTSTANIPGLEPDEQKFLMDTDTQDTRFYVYGNAQLGGSILATVGMSYQDFDADSLEEFKINGVTIGAPGEITNDFSRWNPKFGIQWDLTNNLTARAAYFKAVKPVLVSNRTL